MPFLYITEYGAFVGKNQGRLTVSIHKEEKCSLPLESVDGIAVLGEAVFSTEACKECLRRGIPVLYLSKGGQYFGRLISTDHVNTFRQRQQCRLYDSPFALALAKEIVTSKIHNQSVMLYRAAGEELREQVSPFRRAMKLMEEQASRCEDISSLRGCEGQAARSYFQALPLCLPPEFAFHGRSRRPPRDPFNSLISLGYSIIFNEIWSLLESKGLNPYFGFFHRDDEKHPTLVSDMMEEWRAVIVDALAIAMIRKHEAHLYDFESSADGGVYIQRDFLRKFITRMQQKLESPAGYVNPDGQQSEATYAMLLSRQANALAQAVDEGDASLYSAVRIR
jgi:CRISPR-associated protein Cas1